MQNLCAPFVPDGAIPLAHASAGGSTLVVLRGKRAHQTRPAGRRWSAAAPRPTCSTNISATYELFKPEFPSDRRLAVGAALRRLRLPQLVLHLPAEVRPALARARGDLYLGENAYHAWVVVPRRCPGGGGALPLLPRGERSWIEPRGDLLLGPRAHGTILATMHGGRGGLNDMRILELFETMQIPYLPCSTTGERRRLRAARGGHARRAGPRPHQGAASRRCASAARRPHRRTHSTSASPPS